MEIKKPHRDQIKNQFAEMKTKQDLVTLLNDAREVLYGDRVKKLLTLKELTHFANPAFSKKRYTSFTVKKKSGDDRVINAPVRTLKSILTALNFVLQCIYEPNSCVTGFVLNKSIADNAKKHVGKNYVFNIDLKDFFHSFDRNRVKMGFYTAPFNLRDEREPLAFLLASLCTHPFKLDGKVKTVLPQGSPTSPTITNILCTRLDRRLKGLAKRFKVSYSRYADDITFSASHNVFKKEDFLNELKRIIEVDQKLLINPKKTRLQKTGYKQEVTGLVVNEKVNVHKRYIKQIRMWLYYWQRYGYNKAEEIFLRDYISDKGHVKSKNAKLEHVLEGKLLFLKMVKGPTDSTYLSLLKRFDKLMGNVSPIGTVLGIWEKEGVEKAMSKFYKEKTQCMAGNKYDFMKALLRDNKLRSSERERVLRLASKEIGLDGGNLEDRIKRVEKVLKLSEPPKGNNEGEVSNSLPSKYVSPHYLYKFLFEYNQNRILRTTCHTFDSSDLEYYLENSKSTVYSYELHLAQIITEFNKLVKTHKDAPFKVRALIRGYLTGKDTKGNKLKNGWSSAGIEVNWSSEELKKWSKENPGVPPNHDGLSVNGKEPRDFRIEQIVTVISYDVIQSFTQLTLHFKNLFHLKSGRQSLKSITQRVNEEKEWSKKIDFSYNEAFTENLELFTDVDKLVQTYKRIIELVLDQHKKDGKPKVDLDFRETENGNVIFSIKHKEAQYNKTLQDCLNRPYGQAYSQIIQNQVNGLCNLYLIADFGNKEYAEVNLWNGKELRAKPLDEFNGVEHRLEFTKK